MITRAGGRPIRFFLALMAGWTAIRIFSFAEEELVLTPPAADPVQSADPTAMRPASLMVGSDPAPRKLAAAFPFASDHQDRKTASVFAAATRSASGMQDLAPSFVPSAEGVSPAFPSGRADATPALRPPESAPSSEAPSLVSFHEGPGRWRGSAWLLWRDGGTTSPGTLAPGRLGGSQAGLRIAYEVSPPRASTRSFLYGRLSAALNTPAAPEAAVGLGWQPARTVPVTIATERRIALGRGARNAQAMFAAGGFGPTAVALGLEAEGYAQAGMVGLRSRDLFADGKLSLMVPLRCHPLRIGGSISGGAQPGVERLDISPEIQVRLPIPNMASRVSVEWRERIAGQASPPSGLTVTLGGDF